MLALCCATASANESLTIEDAQHLFYNGRYDAAADLALHLQSLDGENLAAYELRSSALHFQLRDALGPLSDREKAFKQCAACGMDGQMRGVADTHQMRGEAGVVEIQLGGLDQSFAKVLVVRLEQKHDVARVQHRQSGANRLV